MRQNELERVLGSLNSLQERGELSSETHKTLQNLCAQLSQRLTNKHLHAPLQALHQAEDEHGELRALVTRLFNLHHNDSH